MKRNIEKKLTLKKETVTSLNDEHMNQVLGGVSRTCGTHFCYTEELTCNTCIRTECACSRPCIITEP